MATQPPPPNTFDNCMSIIMQTVPSISCKLILFVSMSIFELKPKREQKSQESAGLSYFMASDT